MRAGDPLGEWADYPEDDMAKFELDKQARTYLDLPIESMFTTEVPEARAWLRARE